MMNKPVIWTDGRILNLDSGFKHKHLCTGPTFTAGTACAYKCVYCYVEAIVGTKPFVAQVLGGQSFQNVVIRRNNAVDTLKSELYTKKGVPKYKNKTGVIYGSPLVDIAATKELAEETIAIVRILLDGTGWEIRLLSKSPLITMVAKAFSSPDDKKRIIFGISTGTLDDQLARVIEPTCPAPSARCKALRWLQDNQYRTFGMLCPILPQPLGPFVQQAIAEIRPEKCEYVWAEVFNSRGDSMGATLEALQKAGLTQAATDFKSVCGPDNKASWEQYARDTFTALASAIPAKYPNGESKLRFLQYVIAASAPWWRAQIPNGAVVLRSRSEKPKAQKAGTPAPALPIPAPVIVNGPTSVNGSPQAVPAVIQNGTNPIRSAGAKKAWVTIRANRAKAAAAALLVTGTVQP
jgi:DNA repair photolyase